MYATQMRGYLINRLWRPTRVAQAVNRDLTAKTEQAAGFSSKPTKAKLAWKRTANLVEIRFRSQSAVEDGACIQLTFNRNEVFLMASRYLRSMSDEDFLAKVRKAGGLSEEN